MSMGDVSAGVALGAGLLSFFSPCVLPMVPVYLGYLAGGPIADLEPRGRQRLVLHAVLFVLGFGLVFVSLGIAASLVGQLLMRHLSTIVTVGGVLLIVLGMHMAGLIRLPGLNTQKRLVSGRPGRAGLGGAFLLGFVFAAGWSPCVGPVLGGILLLAADAQTTAQGGLLLGIYTLGLGLPFVGVAAAMGAILPLARRMNRYTRHVSVIGGVLLIALGFSMVTGLYGTIFGSLPNGF
jgi:cytochrome c-type biogenesis protein